MLPHLCDLLFNLPDDLQVLYFGADHALLSGLHAFMTDAGRRTRFLVPDLPLLIGDPGRWRTLAEPTLTTTSGEAARFLAGGEFPVPSGEDTTGKVSITFKSYGVGLGVTPVVLSEGRISLKISTEVSELTHQGSFNLTAGTSTLTIPGLNVRRAETVVELPSGGAMMIAGLLKQETKQNIESLPGLMNLPVLGALFRSDKYQRNETELVIIVTPYLVRPTDTVSALKTPGDDIRPPSDFDRILSLRQVGHTRVTRLPGQMPGQAGFVVQ